MYIVCKLSGVTQLIHAVIQRVDDDVKNCDFFCCPSLKCLCKSGGGNYAVFCIPVIASEMLCYVRIFKKSSATRLFCPTERQLSS